MNFVFMLIDFIYFIFNSIKSIFKGFYHMKFWYKILVLIVLLLIFDSLRRFVLISFYQFVMWL